MSGIDELMEFSSAKMEKSKGDVVGVIHEAMETFFWDLNQDNEYNEEGYGGEIEQGFHPSSLPERVECVRELMYNYLGVPQDEVDKIEPKLRRIFDNGSDLHDRWQRYFTIASQKYDNIELIGSWKCKGCGYLHSPDKEVSFPYKNKTGLEPMPCPSCGSTRWKYGEFRLRHKDLRLTGKRDLKLVVDGRPLLGEIKSINTFQFGKLYDALPQHKRQFCLYMLMDGTKEGFFLYEDKNTQDYKIFYFEYDGDIISGVIDALKEVNYWIDKKELYKRRDDFPSSKKCKLCYYKKLCAAGQSYIDLEKLVKGE